MANLYYSISLMDICLCEWNLPEFKAWTVQFIAHVALFVGFLLAL